MKFHGFDDVGIELHNGASIIAAIFFEHWEGFDGELTGDFEIAEADFINVVFVFEYSDVVGEASNLVNIPSIIEEETVREGVFKAVSSEIRCGVIGEREEVIVGNFAGEDAVAFELAHDGARIADDLASAFFGGFLGLGVAIHEVDTMFESWVSNAVEKGSESLFFVVGETPDDEGDTDTVCKNGVIVVKIV